MRPTISVIIPTLNEERMLASTLEGLAAAARCEVIVTDGGSSDATCDIARDRRCQVLVGPSGRGRQMNAAAAQASGRILLFLHADTRLPLHFPALVEGALSARGVSGGAFSLKIDSPRPALTAIAIFANLRSRLLQLPYGDQALFTEARTFHNLGGFPETAIMEDVVFVRRLKSCGRIKTLPETASTSSRRWDRLGVVRTFMINQMVLIGYSCGVPTTTLAEWYQRLRGVGG